MQYFRTAQIYLKNIINKFHIFAISEHCLFTEQLDLLKQCTDYRYNCTAVSSDHNSLILSGKRGHGGVAIFWDMSHNDYVEPLSGIDCDRIVEIKYNFPNLWPFFVLAVYLPSSNHDDCLNILICFDLCTIPCLLKTLLLSRATKMPTWEMLLATKVLVNQLGMGKNC